MMTGKIRLFWNEVKQIQQRNSIVFPLNQLKHFGLRKTGADYRLVFKNGYDLSDTITLEIDFAYKLAFVYKNKFNPQD